MALYSIGNAFLYSHLINSASIYWGSAMCQGLFWLLKIGQWIKEGENNPWPCGTYSLVNVLDLKNHPKWNPLILPWILWAWDLNLVFLGHISFLPWRAFFTYLLLMISVLGASRFLSSRHSETWMLAGDDEAVVVTSVHEWQFKENKDVSRHLKKNAFL